MNVTLKRDILVGDRIDIRYKNTLVKSISVTESETLPYEAMIGQIIDLEDVKNSLNTPSINNYDVLLFERYGYKVFIMTIQESCDEILCGDKMLISFENTNEINFPKMIYIMFNMEEEHISILHSEYTNVHKDLFLPYSGICTNYSLVLADTIRKLLELKSFENNSHYYTNTLNNVFLGANVELDWKTIYEYKENGLDDLCVGSVNIPFKL